MAGKTEFSQTQQLTQQQTLQQRISAQQLLVVSLLELNAQELEKRIQDELIDNPTLEDDDIDRSNAGDDEPIESDSDDDTTLELDGESMGSIEDRDDTYDDDNDDSSDYRSERAEMREEIPIDAGTSFLEQLEQQLREQPLDEEQQKIGLFLIGLLDYDGWLHTPLEEIVELLAFRADIDTSVNELEDVLHYIQQFDPPGVGARDLQECLLIQLDRKEPSPSIELAKLILTSCIDDFTKNRRDRIVTTLGISKEEADKAFDELTHLTPHPGLALTEHNKDDEKAIIPDFIMDSADEDAQPILNSTHNHELHVSGDYQRLMKEQAEKGTPDQKREATFWLQKISSAQNFIMAIKQREKTMSDIMQAIYKLQKDFFITGDESTLKPMILKDVEELSGYDSSTVSRMSDKYIQTNDGLYPLKFFFSNRRVKVGGDDSGEYVFSKEVLDALRSLIDSEDKSSPYSDDRLSDMLKAQGFNIARRTVAKYRDRMGVPIARMRKRF